MKFPLCSRLDRVEKLQGDEGRLNALRCLFVQALADFFR